MLSGQQLCSPAFGGCGCCVYWRWRWLRGSVTRGKNERTAYQSYSTNKNKIQDTRWVLVLADGPYIAIRNQSAVASGSPIAWTAGVRGWMEPHTYTYIAATNGCMRVHARMRYERNRDFPKCRIGSAPGVAATQV
eukprot:scaffold8415_cov253-Isochrysis_galbana.AAC.2